MDKKLHDLRHDTRKAEKFFTKLMAYTLGPMELKTMFENHSKDENENKDKSKIVIIDVRDKEDYSAGHIPNAISIPRNNLEERLSELSKDDIHIVYCYNQQCHLGLCACRLLASKDYPCMHLDGGYKVWSEDFRFATVK